MAVHVRRLALAVLMGSALVATPPAAAQDTAVTMTTTRTEHEEDSEFPWGLLGLLGLLGLIPRRKKDVHVHEHEVREVHTRPVPPRDDVRGTNPRPPSV